MTIKQLLMAVALMGAAIQIKATDYYVATNGDDANTGTSLSAPFATITKAISKAYAGDVIYIRGGIYAYTAKVSLTRQGTEASPIRMEAYQNERVVIDFSQMAFSSSNRGLSLSGNYWHIKGLHVQKAGDNGMFISGNNNTVENCSFYANRDTGLQLGNGAANNRIINCDSYGNADPTDYGDADGFACKMDVGTGNYFYGCRAWLNVDDGWDGYMRGANDVSTTLENCWTWRNGYFIDGTDAGANANGNGFKVGGSDDKTLMHNFTLINCVAFDNKSKGFDQNNNRGDMFFHNCTAYRNKGNNYSIPLLPNSGKVAEVVNCVAVDGKISLGSFVTQQTNSWSGFSFGTGDFVSLDTAGVSGPRQTDGSLPNLDVFKLKEGSSLIDGGTDLGRPFNGSAPDLGAFEYNDGSTPVLDVNNSALSVKLLQNPVAGNLSVRFQSDVYETLRLSVVSLTGVTYLQRTVDVVPGEQQVDCMVNALADGVYLLHVASGSTSKAMRFVVKK